MKVRHKVCEECGHWKPYYDETGIEGQDNKYIAEEYCLSGGKHDIEQDENGEFVLNCPIEEGYMCPDCGQTIDKGACFYCKMD